MGHAIRDAMRMRPLGNTKLVSSELGVGTWGLSGEAYGPIPDGEARRVLLRARKMGINLFDTAPGYAEGKMESLLGELFGEESDAIVMTRLGLDRSTEPPSKAFTREFLEKSFEKSQARIGHQPRLLVLLHNPSPSSLENGVAFEFLKDFKKEGSISGWGVATDHLTTAQLALEAKAELLSLAHNIFHSSSLNRLRSQIMLHQTGVCAHSTLSYGLLAGRWSADKQFEWNDHRNERWPGDSLRTRIRQLDAVRPLVAGQVLSMRAAAIRYVLADEQVSCALLGPRNSAQIDQMVRETADLPHLNPGALEALERRLVHLNVER